MYGAWYRDRACNPRTWEVEAGVFYIGLLSTHHFSGLFSRQMAQFSPLPCLLLLSRDNLIWILTTTPLPKPHFRISINKMVLHNPYLNKLSVRQYGPWFLKNPSFSWFQDSPILLLGLCHQFSCFWLTFQCDGFSRLGLRRASSAELAKDSVSQQGMQRFRTKDSKQWMLGKCLLWHLIEFISSRPLRAVPKITSC